MGRKETNPNPSMKCGSCRDSLQEYLDGTLEKKTSLQLFLHLRECVDCQVEHDRLEGMFQLLDNLPDYQAPANIDEKILASVNYQRYRAMEKIRRERVPVYLEKEFLPVMVRSRVTRLAGVGVSILSMLCMLAMDLPNLSGFLPLMVVAGVVPELLVRIQGIGRRVVLAQQSES